MKKFLLTASAALCVASAAFAQPYPANGYIGVFADEAGTQCCATIPAFMPATLYVIARLAGETAGGITGTEFRLEFSENPSASASISWTADAAVAVAIGNPIDFTFGVDPPMGQAEGVNLAWQMCQAGPSIRLGTLSVIIFNGAWAGVDIVTKARNPPGNADPQFACPQYNLCDAEFTKKCLTIPNGTHGQSINFRSAINRAGCNTSCVPVAVTATNWSAVKDLYR